MRLLLLFLTTLFFSVHLFSQSQIMVKGKVLDSSSQDPLPFAYVSLKGFALGTVTNGDGEFLLNIPSSYEDESLVFSYLGYLRETLSLDGLRDMSPILVYLKKDVAEIKEVVVKPTEKISAKQLLKRVMKNIEINYAQAPVNLDGYYRETVAENGAFISYSDAAVQIHYAPYQEQSYSWSDYRMEAQSSVSSLSNYDLFSGRSLHRGHFHAQTINQDQAKVIDSRSSYNLTKTDMNANVQARWVFSVKTT